jgi:hypothetical protein
MRLASAWLLKLCSSVACVLVVSGCAGYELGSPSAEHLKEIKTIFIEPPQNITAEPSLGVALGHALSRRFDQNGRLKTARRNQADASIQVVLRNVSRDPLRSSRENIHRTMQYQSTLQAEITVINRKGEAVLPSRSFEGKTKYFTQADLQESERQGWEVAIEELADRIVSYVAESGW